MLLVMTLFLCLAWLLHSSGGTAGSLDAPQGTRILPISLRVLPQTNCPADSFPMGSVQALEPNTPLPTFPSVLPEDRTGPGGFICEYGTMYALFVKPDPLELKIDVSQFDRILVKVIFPPGYNLRLTFPLTSIMMRVSYLPVSGLSIALSCPEMSYRFIDYNAVLSPFFVFPGDITATTSVEVVHPPLAHPRDSVLIIQSNVSLSQPITYQNIERSSTGAAEFDRSIEVSGWEFTIPVEAPGCPFKQHWHTTPSQCHGSVCWGSLLHIQAGGGASAGGIEFRRMDLSAAERLRVNTVMAVLLALALMLSAIFQV